MTRHTLPRLFSAALLTVTAVTSPASADTYPRQPGIDVVNYAFSLTLADTTDTIAGEAAIDIRVKQANVREVRLDLVAAGSRADGKGMAVSRVLVDGSPATFTHDGRGLTITLAAAPREGTRVRLSVTYQGVPAQGLRVGSNRHGERTFFSDNWPDLGRHWLPLVDHPSDKATCEFIVTAPALYQVVSNGTIVEETDLPGALRRTHWRQSVPIAPWLFTLGVARFAVQHVDDFGGKPIQTWVYARDRDAGFADFADPSRHVLEYFTDAIGPYVYQKLANIQSPATGGGMEAASAIMYGENLVNGQRQTRVRDIVIHEIAHQWWGNAVTESDWDDVWLSEGFATYFTLLFQDHAYGHDAFVGGLLNARKRVFDFHAKNPGYRIVHDNLADTSKVATSQQYQMGAWVLHMLRGLVGDAAFWKGIRAYYAEFVNGNSTTADFQRAMEAASGRPLGTFFDQWLRRGGLPALTVTWTYDAGALVFTVTQTQREAPYVIDLPIEIIPEEGPMKRELLSVKERQQTFKVAADGPARAVTIDPDHWVLLEATAVRR